MGQFKWSGPSDMVNTGVSDTPCHMIDNMVSVLENGFCIIWVIWMVSAWAVESHTGRSAVQKWPTLLRIYFAKKNKLYVIESVIGSIFMFLFFWICKWTQCLENYSPCRFHLEYLYLYPRRSNGIKLISTRISLNTHCGLSTGN